MVSPHLLMALIGKHLVAKSSHTEKGAEKAIVITIRRALIKIQFGEINDENIIHIDGK